MRRVVLSVLFFFSAAFYAQGAMNKATSIHHTESGNPTGLPVIFIHAFPLHQAMWDEQAAFLAKTARVIRFDIRGLGKSKRTGPYTLEFVVDDLITLMDQLHLPKAVVCGLSMGGFVALRALERHPERFIAAVLADTKSEPDSDSSKLGRYRGLKTIEAQGLSAFAEGFLRSSVAANGQSENPRAFERAKKIADSNDAAGVSLALLALTSRTDTTAALEKIRVPTLVMQGEFDTVIPMAAAQVLHDKIPASEFYVVPKAGHLSNLENPQAFNARLAQFLAGVGRK